MLSDGCPLTDAIAVWEYQTAHQGALPDDPAAAAELEAIANRLISEADVNKQTLPSIPRELIECVCLSRDIG